MLLFYILLFLSLFLQKSLKSGRDCCLYIRTEPSYLSTQIKSSLIPTPRTENAGDDEYWRTQYSYRLERGGEGPGCRIRTTNVWLQKSTAFLETSRRSTFRGPDATPRGFCKLLHCSFIMWSDEYTNRAFQKKHPALLTRKQARFRRC